LDPSSP